MLRHRSWSMLSTRPSSPDAGNDSSLFFCLFEGVLSSTSSLSLIHVVKSAPPYLSSRSLPACATQPCSSLSLGLASFFSACVSPRHLSSRTTGRPRRLVYEERRRRSALWYDPTHTDLTRLTTMIVPPVSSIPLKNARLLPPFPNTDEVCY